MGDKLPRNSALLLFMFSYFQAISKFKSIGRVLLHVTTEKKSLFSSTVELTECLHYLSINISVKP